MAKKKVAPKKAKSAKPEKKKAAPARQAKPAAKKAAAPPAKKAPVKAKPAPKAPAKAEKPAKAALPPKKEGKKGAAAKAEVIAEKAIPGKKGKGEGKKAPKEPVLTPAEMAAAEAEVILTNADGKRYCKVGECDELATSDSYCRYHYLLNWKKIQLRKKILAGDKLNRYIEELTARYPDKYLEMIRKDL
ncbi:MAG TPA: hypothetical protein VFV50_04720, partial [Bdellovibrionales bacterium]|nr:hypothetical protein [Bdellovibrionales bacterium]